MKLLILFLFSSSLFTSLSCSKAKSPSSPNVAISDSSINNPSDQRDSLVREMKQKQIEYFIIKVPGGQYGYYIMVDGGMYIEQKTIPAISGNKGFATKEEAEKIAKLVVTKIL